MSNAIPQGWRLQAIDEFARTSAGGTPSTQVPAYWENGIIPWMSSGEVHKKRVKNVAQKITKLGFQNSSAKLFPKGTILIALAGQGKTRGTVAISEIELTTNQSIAGVIVKDKTVSPDYVYQNLDSRYEELRAASGGSGRAGLNLTIIGEQQLTLPPLPEQKKIAAILTSVDEVIEKTRAQIDKLKDLKTGMMQELLTKGIGQGGVPHTEFKDSPVGRIPSSWEVLPLEELCIKIGVGIASSTTHAYASEGVPLLRNQNILPDAIRHTDMLLISKNFSEENAAKKIRSGDVITVRTGYPGVSAVVPDEYDGCHSFTTLISRPKKTKLNPHFLSMLINSDYGKSFVLGGQAGGAQQNLNVSVLKTLPVILPPLSEQKEIFTAMNGATLKINLINKKLAMLIDAKKALMQDLLTGKVRVQVDIRELADA